MATSNHIGREGFMSRLEELGIDSSTVEHPEVFTVEAMMPYVSHLPGAHCKNLFLRDKKKKLYLFSARHDLDIKLNDLAKKVGAPGGFRFADESILYEKLGVKQGCVTAYALINDINCDVKFLLDDTLINGGFEKLFFHPIDNAASTGMSPENFLKYLDSIKHPPTLVKCEDS